MRGSLYVESRIRAGVEEVWARTQEPSQHQRWDLRFTEIACLPADGPTAPTAPTRFRYAVRLLPGLVVGGTGVAAGERHRPDGTRTSALRFHSAHPLSPLAEGSGYWRYVPDGDAVRFLTGYDYTPRWGRFGRVADRQVFRPLMGWATAWSFDRLRLWCEDGVRPERALLHALGDTGARLAAVLFAFVGAGAASGTVLALLALALPPLPRTPAARRCLRRPPRVRTGSAVRQSAPPSLLTRLEKP